MKLKKTLLRIFITKTPKYPFTTHNISGITNSNLFSIQDRSLLKLKEYQKNNLAKNEILNYSHDIIYDIINTRFLELFPGENPFYCNKKVLKFLEWLCFVFFNRTNLNVSFQFIDKIFSKEESNQHIQNSPEFLAIIRYLWRFSYKNTMLLDMLLKNLILNSNQINLHNFTQIMMYFTQCDYNLNDELLCDFLSKLVLKKKSIMNYNHASLSLNNLSFYNHTPDYLWKDFDQYILLLIKRLFKPVSLYRVVTAFDTIAHKNKNKLNFDIWIIIKNFIENNNDFFFGAESLTCLNLAIIGKNIELSPRFEEILQNYFRREEFHSFFGVKNSLQISYIYNKNEVAVDTKEKFYRFLDINAFYNILHIQIFVFNH